MIIFNYIRIMLVYDNIHIMLVCNHVTQSTMLNIKISEIIMPLLFGI